MTGKRTGNGQLVMCVYSCESRKIYAERERKTQLFGHENQFYGTVARSEIDRPR